MPTFNDDPVVSRTMTNIAPGINGESDLYNGVRGITHAPGHAAVAGISEVSNADPQGHPERNAGPGVFGQSEGAGVFGTSTTWVGVYGETAAKSGAGVWGTNKADGSGVVGISEGNGVGAGVYGEGRSLGPGGFFKSSTNEGVHGETNSQNTSAIAGIQLNEQSTGAGVYGAHTGGGPGGFFSSQTGVGLHGETNSPVLPAIVGIQRNSASTGAGIYGEHISGGTAGFFKGNVVITGDCFFPGADFAEDFTIRQEAVATPGTVMALSETGELVPCRVPYDTTVVGVVPGAGTFRTGITMDKQEESVARREPVALVGKVFCNADASYGAIEVGDLLTSSPTPGHAMKASDPARAFGSVIGKAMAPLDEGCGLIPILISLQ
ncbi:hypothetical protein [Nitrosospira sp. Is2]|uniref:hypothetical protein n=1 Tax=Nitrosospira sp. Is2 TaxID=3080532 RepID=UPI002954E20B|nr:hypothetical protein [Nitrosospira sp. Is2]WON74184.1 hypothetical protein R5L00_01455 [Nitrosospira sp. Is2]